MGTVIVVTGPPGSGKSTVADGLVGHLAPSALVAGDDFFAFLRKGAIAPWLEEAHEQNTAVTEAAAAATGRLAKHCDVVYDGVVGPWFLETFRLAAGVTRLHYALLLPPLETCLERVETRVGHGFTDLGAAEHMWWQMHRADVAARHVISGLDESPAEIAVGIAQKLRDGSLTYPERTGTG
jgi:cytidylate kinase